MNLSLHAAINQLYHAQKNILRPQMLALGLSPGQPKLLRYLAAHNNCIQRELAENCNIEAATVSRLLDNMEKQGLVNRTLSPDNRRITLVGITPKGLHAHREWTETSKDFDGQILQGFSPAEKKDVENYVERMYENLTGRTLE